MKLLAIDTSTDTASIALWNGEGLETRSLSGQRQHAEAILSLVDEVCQASAVSIQDLEGIVFGQGPGSFTGLRVAVSVAKGLAYARDLPVYPVSTLQAIAYEVQALYPEQGILAVLDARMQELYWAYYPCGSLVGDERVSSPGAISLEVSESLVLAGVGYESYWEHLPVELRAKIDRQRVTSPSASAMIALVQAGMIAPVSASAARPVYIRNQVTQGGTGG